MHGCWVIIVFPLLRIAALPATATTGDSGAAADTEWGYYYTTDPTTDDYYHEYMIYETNGRSSLACPKGYYISSVLYSFAKQGENATVNNTDGEPELYFDRDAVVVLQFEDRLRYYLQQEVSEADKIHRERGGVYRTRELKQLNENIPHNGVGDTRANNAGNTYNFAEKQQMPPKFGLPGAPREGPPPPGQMPPGGYPEGHPLHGMPVPLDAAGHQWKAEELERFHHPPPGPDASEHTHTNKGDIRSKHKLLTHYYTERIKFDFFRRHGPCDTIGKCLGHQACIFYMGNSFCQNDPMPGIRKFMKMMLKCAIDHTFDSSLNAVLEQHGLELVPDRMGIIRGWTDNVQYITVTPGLRLGMETINTKPIPESIFRTTCPTDPKAAGYIGNCTGTPQTAGQTAKKLWSVLGRVSQDSCRHDIIAIYCAYQFNNTGKCVPPTALEVGVSHSDESPVVSFSSLPYNLAWPDRTSHKKISEDPHAMLIPVRIGFLIMGHTAADAIVQLVHILHRPQHFYVIHIDSSAPEVREVLLRLLDSWFPEVSNIRILPAERSFRTSWGSYEIIRAELEGMEELLRMGVWDFVINLSGADLPIRSVDDLADHLAEYRGTSLIRQNGLKPLNYTEDVGIKCAWHACHGHLYNVTFGRGEIDTGIISSSQWGVFHRDFVEMIVSRNRPRWLSDLQFYLQTALIPDETYMATIIAHRDSPFRMHYLRRGLTVMSPFVGEDSDALCRHREETDICGRGPGEYTGVEMPGMLMAAHAMFFARKFNYHLGNPVRAQIASMIEVDHYTQDLWRAFPPVLTWRLCALVVEHMQERSGLEIELIDAARLRVTPRHTSRDPCCEKVRDSMWGSIAMEYNYLLDLNVRVGETIKQVKSSLSARHPFLHTCYPAGHIRLMHITTRRDALNQDLRANPNNLPMPYDPIGGDMFWIQMAIQLNPIDDKCNATLPRHSDTYVTWPDVHMKVLKLYQFDANIINPDGRVVCRPVIDIQPFLNEPYTMETMFTKDLRCPELKVTSEGIWKIKITQKDVANPMSYEKSILLLQEPLNHVSVEKYITEAFTNEMFTINDAAFTHELMSSNYYPEVDPRSHRPSSNKMVQQYKENLIEWQGYNITLYMTFGIFAVLLFVTYKLYLKKNTTVKRSTKSILKWIGAIGFCIFAAQCLACHLIVNQAS